MILKDRSVIAYETETPVDAEVNTVTWTMYSVYDGEVDDNDENTESTTELVVDRTIYHHFAEQGTRYIVQ